MEINSDAVGTELSEYTTQVTWRDTMNYAAAIDDANPCYFDDEREEGIIAHPLFSVALLWPMIERIREIMERRGYTPEIIATMVHYSEYLQFHRPVIPGDHLSITGSIAAIVPHRSGTHVITRLDAKSDTAPVFTEFSGILLRGVQCADEGSGGNEIPRVPEYSGDNPSHWESIIYINELRPYLYDGCTDIFFPIHTSKKFARSVGLPGIILQGTATLAYAAREIINREAGGDPRQLKSISCRFTGMVLPGTDIHIILDGSEALNDYRNLFFHVLSQGERAISRGYARIQG